MRRSVVVAQTRGSETFPVRNSIRECMHVKAVKTTDIAKTSADLVEQYRPLGLKAVLAAALQAKAKPAATLKKQPA